MKALAVSNACPKCGGEVTFGFGLAGGGYGPYELCLADGCDHFRKWQSDDGEPAADQASPSEDER